MKNTRKSRKFLSLVLGAVLAVGALFAVPVSAGAATATKSYVTYQQPDYGTSCQYVSVSNVTGRNVNPSKVTNLKATNGVNVSVDYAHTNRYAMIYVKFNKNFLGTTKISFNIGKQSYAFNYTAKKYVNPASTFTVDGNSQVYQLNNHAMSHHGSNNGIHKVTIKAKSGWTIKKVSALSNRWFLNREFNTNTFNARIDNFRLLRVTYQNVSNGATITQEVDMMNYAGK